MNFDTASRSTVDRLLDSAEAIFVRSGFEKTTFATISAHSGLSVSAIKKLYPCRLDLMVAMLNREYMKVFQGVVEDIERDPLGGLLSRMYTYIMSQIYQRPVARTLFMIDKNALHDITSHQHAIMYIPSIETREELIRQLQEVGMVKKEADPALASRVLSVISGGLAITSPHKELDAVVGAMMQMIRDQFDADVTDTRAGKKVYHEWASRLARATKAPELL
jgi:AcrR family transcriptional regulator